MAFTLLLTDAFFIALSLPFVIVLEFSYYVQSLYAISFN